MARKTARLDRLLAADRRCGWSASTSAAIPSGKHKYIGESIHGGLRAAQAHINHMLAERDLGRNIRSSRQTLGPVSRSLARYLCPAAAAGEELSRLLDPARTVSVHHWVQDYTGSFRLWRSKHSTANCSIGSCRHERFATRTRSSFQRCGRRYVGSFF